ncbi:HutD family protein [Amycolatopsis sp. K13G38]|uniref:HutD family protein n=1 Tax=Amycolatopsis acididurans TaxID=2724524 RepID=A0ABX1JD60_9PSEU|nr:HutD family protein [Amycolatopsis acididurans]NKQ57674.1 HutD family protein [Amycolatopsis acididurans]
MLDPARVTPVPWRNGAGSTRELATTSDPRGHILWRVSLAELVHDAPFATFPGMERLFTALGRLRLTIDGTPVELSPGEQIRFAGEAPVTVSPARPTRALNVMTRRGSFRAQVVLRSPRQPVTHGTVTTVDFGENAADILVTPLTKVAHD